MSAEKLALADERAQLMAERRRGYTGSPEYIESEYMWYTERLATIDKLIGRL